MRKISTFVMALFLGATATKAQTVATFDTLSLTGTDTFYANYTSLGNDVGFDDGLARFPCVYDTSTFSGGYYWVEGFAYTNQTDISDSTYTNLYTAVPANGYNSSAQYLSVSAYSPQKIYLKGKAQGQPVKGFYATNLVYGYKEMITDGGMFGKKMGGIPNVDPDWFKLTVKGYLNGSMKTDSVDFYLADFRDADSTKDYIVTTWEWVDLLPLGEVDSLELSLSSTDTAGGFGMNNPAYFAMDNFETFETSSVPKIATAYAAKLFPNPATDKLYIELKDETVEELLMTDMSGKLVLRQAVTENVLLLNTSNYAQGVYLVQFAGSNGTAVARFVKQ